MLTIRNLTVCHREAPIGLDEAPAFGWVLHSDQQNVLQTAYQIEVAGIWDSGKEESDASVAVAYSGPALQPLTEYSVTLTVWDNHGEQASAQTTFETGLLTPATAAAQWITHDLDAEVPVFFTEFEAKNAVKARLLASACGVYSAAINGQPVSEDRMAPGWTNYRSRIQYQTYDVTTLIAEQNRLELTVAPGWYAGYLNGEGRNHHYGDKVAAWAELHLWYADGTTAAIASDTGWQVTTGPILSGEIYHGETIDTTAAPAAPRGALPFDGMDNSRLVAQQSHPVRVTEKVKPIELIHTPKGEVVLDFGQNLPGVVEVTVDGQPGQTIILRHAEVLDKDGNFYTTNLRTARATDTFVCKGGKEIFCPRFTFHGFRYVAVEGMGENPDLGAFRACVLHSDLPLAATFESSAPLVDRLWQNINWSMRANFIDLPTDCPQRDERLGWTGDAAIFSETACQLRDSYLFFQKWLADLASEQTLEFGIPDTIPNILMPPGTPSGGSAVWGDSATIVPWSAYLASGDAMIIARQYQSMKNWVEYIRRTETPNHLHTAGHQRGDWLAMDREEGVGNRGYTDPYLLSTAFYAHSTWILAQSAAILGKEDEAAEYGKLYEQIKENFQKEYITNNGRLVSETQTACALVLCLGLAKPEDEKRIIQTLADNLARHQGRITTGFIGTPYLCEALSRFGRSDLAGKLLLNEDYPGWLHEIKLGATTIWERWDSKHDDGTFDESGMNSFNHYSFGAVGTWMLHWLAGLQPAAPGYKRIHVCPQLVQGITNVAVTRQTPYGELACSWMCKDGKITVDVTIPANTTAEVHLPEKDEVLELGSGSYHYEYATDTRLEPQKYTMDSTIAQLTEHPLFIQRVEAIMPGAGQGLRMEFMQNKTLGEMLTMMPAGAGAAFKPILDAMNAEE